MSTHPLPLHNQVAIVTGGSRSIGKRLAIQTANGEPETVSRAVAYLASPQAAFVSGAELLVDGGFTA